MTNERSRMRVPLVDLGAQHRAIREEVLAAAIAVVDAQSFILGEPVRAFERALSMFCGTSHAVGVASGTDALGLALRAVGIGQGDVVITTPFTFVATAEAIVHVGARPVFADVDARTMNLDPASVEERLAQLARTGGARARAILPVHLYGACADMTALRAVARRHDLVVVEDAAQAIGATHDGVRAGALGDAGCFSFFPSKNLGAWGDGGAVVTSRGEVAERVRRLRVHGASGTYVHEEMGMNSRLDALHAAVLHAKLAHLEAWNEARERVASWYREELEGISDRVILPAPRSGSRHAYNQFVVRTARRDDLQKHLAERGVESRVYYPVPLHRQRCFAAFVAQEDACPNADAAAREVLALPMYAELSRDAVRYVGAEVRAFCT